MLNYMGESRVITKVLKYGRNRHHGKDRQASVGFKDGSQPRNVGSLYNLAKARKQSSPRAYRRNPRLNLDLGPVRPVSDC